MRGNGFTLIEMLVVIALAMILMTMGAAAFNNLSHSQKLSIGAGAVNAALQQARAHALKTKRLTAVYFLDGGEYETVGGSDANSNAQYCDNDREFNSYEDYVTNDLKYTAPYELVLWQDDTEVSRVKLPEGIGWLDARSFLTGTFGNTAADRDRPYYQRPCSLVINFSSTGSAWAQIENNRALVDWDSGTGIRSQESCRNIRVFNIEDIRKFDGNSNGKGSSDYIMYNGKFWNRIKKANTVNSVVHQNYKAAWSTVRINYLTGLTEIINGHNEEDRADYSSDN